MPEPQANPAIAAQRRKDALCDEFEEQWTNGVRPPLSDFVARVPPEERAAVTKELVALDCSYRRHRGETPIAEDYLQQLPDLAAPIEQAMLSNTSRGAGDPPSTEITHGGTADTIGLPAPAASPSQGKLPEIPGYEMLGFIAQGGMGVVYRARDKKLAREVAIKMPRSGYIGSPQEKERFVREAVAAARLRHPNICPVFEVREVNNQPYIAMAFIRGPTLKVWRKELEPRPRQVAELVAVVARAVQAAHDQGVIHRDLKPSNIMVDPDSGQPMLMDFGLAKDLTSNDGLTMSGDLIGTPAYMAPEQAAGKASQISTRSDIYSLGAILYELLTGRAPFEGTLAEVLDQVQQREPESIRRRNAKIHRDLVTICAKAMAKRPEDRYASAKALAEDLDRFASGEPILARRQGWLKQGLRIVRKYPVVSGLTATLVVLLVAGGIAYPQIQRKIAATQRAKELATGFHTDLQSPDWNLDRLAKSDEVAAKLAQLDPGDAARYRNQVTARLESYIDNYLKRIGKLEEQDRKIIDAAIAELTQRAPERGAARTAVADRRFGRWEKVAELQPPFADSKLLPGLSPTDDSAALRPPVSLSGSERFLTASHCEGNYQVEAKFESLQGATCGVVLYAREAHTGEVSALAVSPDGRWIAAGSGRSGPIRIWDSATSAEAGQIEGHQERVCGLAFDPEGKYLVSTATDGLIKVWDFTTRKLLGQDEVEAKPSTSATAFHMPPLAVPKNASVAYVGTRTGIICYSIPSLERLDPVSELSTDIIGLSVSDKGDRLAATTLRGGVEVWKTNPPELLWNQQNYSIPFVAVRPDGQAVAGSTTGNLVRLYDAATGKVIESMQAQEGLVQALAFHPGGKLLAAGHGDPATLRLWDTAEFAPVGTHYFRQGVTTALAFEPRGDFLVLGTTNGTIHVLDAFSGQERWALASQSYSFLVTREPSGNGRMQITRSGAVLRDVVQPLGFGPISVSAKRDNDKLQLQVNQNPPVEFTDVFPPRNVAGGVWGVHLEHGAKLGGLTVRRSLPPAERSVLEEGEDKFRSGKFDAALERFQEFLANPESANDQSVQQDAQLKSALCLLRLNRTQEAQQRLQELSAEEGATPSLALARFQLWLLYAQQYQWPAADALAPIVELKHPYDEMSGVISLDLLNQIYDLYAREAGRRSSPLVAGSATRLETVERLGKYFRIQSDQAGNLRWSLFQGYRMTGKDQQARKLAQELLAGRQAELERQRQLPEADDYDEIEGWHLAGLLARWLGKPESLEALLDDRLLQGGQLRADIRGSGWGLVLERARLHAARGEWERVVELLKDAWPPRDHEYYFLVERVNTGLLHGVALRKLGRESAAQDVWGRLLDTPEVAECFADLEDETADTVMPLLVLRGVANRFDEVLVGQLTEYTYNRINTTGGVGQILSQFPLSASTMQAMWQSKHGEDIAEQIARGELFVTEQMKQIMLLYAKQMVLFGAFEEPTPAEEELVWQTANLGFADYTSNQLTVPTFLQLGLAWKGIPAPLGWKFAFTGVSPELKAPLAYILANRFLLRDRADVAKPLLELTVEYAKAEQPVRKLAEAALEKLKQP